MRELTLQSLYEKANSAGQNPYTGCVVIDGIARSVSVEDEALYVLYILYLLMGHYDAVLLTGEIEERDEDYILSPDDLLGVVGSLREFGLFTEISDVRNTSLKNRLVVFQEGELLEKGFRACVRELGYGEEEFPRYTVVDSVSSLAIYNRLSGEILKHSRFLFSDRVILNEKDIKETHGRLLAEYPFARDNHHVLGIGNELDRIAYRPAPKADKLLKFERIYCALCDMGVEYLLVEYVQPSELVMLALASVYLARGIKSIFKTPGDEDKFLEWVERIHAGAWAPFYRRLPLICDTANQGDIRLIRTGRSYELGIITSVEYAVSARLVKLRDLQDTFIGWGPDMEHVLDRYSMDATKVYTEEEVPLLEGEVRGSIRSLNELSGAEDGIDHEKFLYKVLRSLERIIMRYQKPIYANESFLCEYMGETYTGIGDVKASCHYDGFTFGEYQSCRAATATGGVLDLGLLYDATPESVARATCLAAQECEFDYCREVYFEQWERMPERDIFLAANYFLGERRFRTRMNLKLRGRYVEKEYMWLETDTVNATAAKFLPLLYTQVKPYGMSMLKSRDSVLDIYGCVRRTEGNVIYREAFKNFPNLV